MAAIFLLRHHGILASSCPAHSVFSLPSVLELLFYLAEAFFERAHGEVRLFLINQERRRQANGILTRAEHEQTLVEREINDVITQIRGFFLSPPIPLISPRPRTSPTILKFFVQLARRPKR